jgi:integrase
MSSKRGLGCVYQRNGKKTWWIKYSCNGKTYYESSNSRKEADAKRLLAKRMGEIAEDRFMGPGADKILLADLCEDFLNDYLVNKKRSLVKAKRSVKHLLEYFGSIRARDVTTDKIRKFVGFRQAAGISNAEINRELAALKRLFNLGLYAEKIVKKPHIPMLQENNVRKGFFEADEYNALLECLPDYLQPVIIFAYITGWRKEEILGLSWNQVDFRAGVIRIDPGVTKGGEGRTIFMEGQLLEAMTQQQALRRIYCPFVFHRDGHQIRDFRHAWENAIQKSHNEGKIFHDLRRTAVRNMVRAGVPERIAMSISGHKTRSVFDRYNIVSETDLREAAVKVNNHYLQRTVTPLVTPLDFNKKKGQATKRLTP